MSKRLLLLSFTALTLSAQLPQDDKRLVFSTFLGGNRTDDSGGVAVDQEGNIYVAGRSDSGDFSGRGLGAINLAFAVSRAYVTKYSPDGKQILWSHIFGGSSNTRANAVVVDSAGNAYVAGTTGAKDFPLTKPVQDRHAGLNIAFLMKFDPQGNVQFSTYFGGERNEDGNCVAVDSQGNIYLGGRASSTNLPVRNAMQPQMAGGGQDAFIAKYTPDFQLAYATYFGGTAGTDNIFAMAVGPDDALYVTGENMSPGMATEGAWIRTPPSYSSYVAKIAPEGDRVLWFSYLGHRSGYTKSEALAVDGQGRAWVGGITSAKSWPMTENAFQKNYAGGHRDGFLVRMSADGSTAEYASYLGGSHTGQRDPDDTVQGIRVDWRGHLYITGETYSPDFPTHRALQSNFGGDFESYLLHLDPETNTVVMSTFWGGSKRDWGAAVAFGPGENVTIVGETASDNLPLKDAFRRQFGPSTDAFVARICDPWPAAWPAQSLHFGYTLGTSETPAPQDLHVVTGCTVPFDVSEVVADQPWVTVRAEGRTAPFKMTIEVNPAEMPAGEHKASIRIRVPAAFYSELIVPVTLYVAEPQPAQ